MLPLLWLSLALVGGVILASLLSLPVPAWLGLAAASILFSAVWRRVALRSGIRPLGLEPATQFFIAVCLATLFLGGLRYQSNLPRPDPFFIGWYNDRDYDVTVTGTIIELPDARDAYTNLKIQTESINTGSAQDLPVKGLLLTRAPVNSQYGYGDRLQLRGQLQTPPENEEFSYRDYLARQGIHSYMPDVEIALLPDKGGNAVVAWIYAFKEKAFENLHQIFTDPESDLLAGILLGMDNGIPADLQKAFKDTGTAHIIAISGFNIAIIANLFLLFFSRVLGERRGSLAAILGIAFYTFLVGADAAVVRAAIMGSAGIIARLFGRRQDGLNTLAFVAAGMTLVNPLVLWDVGFQLSFAATLGLILYAEPFEQAATAFLHRHLPASAAERITGPLAEYFLFTLAAQLTTLPIMAYHFQQVSLIAFLANPFVLPVQPPLMLTAGLAMLLSLVYMPLGKLVALLAWPFTAYTIRMVEWFAGWPNGVLELGEFSLLSVIIFYAALFAWTFAGERIRSTLADRGIQLKPMTALFALGIVAVLTWRVALSAPDGQLHLTFLDVGSADAILVQTPGGRTVLINGGPSLSKLSDALGRRLPPLERRIDWLVVASTQENQVAALPRALDRFPPENVLWAGKVESSFSAAALSGWVTLHGVPLTEAERGQNLDFGSGVSLRVLTSGARGAVLLLEWGAFRALLPVGLNFDALDELQKGRSVGPVSVLLLGESGFGPINPPEWITALNPQLIVISVAAGDRDGLPDRNTLDEIKDYSVLRTDRNGWIQVTSDGTEMWVEVERK